VRTKQSRALKSGHVIYYYSNAPKLRISPNIPKFLTQNLEYRQMARPYILLEYRRKN
jgi:hypothetical protein